MYLKLAQCKSHCHSIPNILKPVYCQCWQNSLYLQIAQVYRSQDLAIFLWMRKTTTRALQHQHWYSMCQRLYCSEAYNSIGTVIMSGGNHYLLYKASYMHMCKEYMAQQVGVVDRPWLKIHYLWCSWPRCRTIGSIVRPVFHRFWGILLLYKSLSGLNCPNWRFSCRHQWKQTYKLIALPLMHAHGVNTLVALVMTSGSLFRRFGASGKKQCL